MIRLYCAVALILSPAVSLAQPIADRRQPLAGNAQRLLKALGAFGCQESVAGER